MKCQGWLQIIVKFLNSLLLVIGILMVLYSVWMLQHLHGGDRDDDENGFITGRPFLRLVVGKSSSKLGDGFSLPVPWFVYSFMGIGILVCLIAIAGYGAAEAASGCCLCCYSVSMGVFIILQGVLAAVIFFDKSWEQDFPNDPTGEIHSLRRMVESNAEFCKGVALGVVVLEVLSLMFGMILRAVIGDFGKSNEDSDDEYHYVPPPRTRPYTQAGSSSSRNWSPRLQQQKSTAGGS